MCLVKTLYGWVAQQVEQRTENPCRVDSISAPATIGQIEDHFKNSIKKDRQWESTSKILRFLCVVVFHMLCLLMTYIADVAAGIVPFLYISEVYRNKNYLMRESFYI